MNNNYDPFFWLNVIANIAQLEGGNVNARSEENDTKNS